MTMRARNPLAALAMAALLAGAGCGRLSIEPLERPPDDLIVLLPDRATGAVGAATVSAPAGVVQLTHARAATRVAQGRAPSEVTTLDDTEVERIFGGALAALPPAPQTFTLHFQFESEDLTAESKALLGQTLQAVKLRPVPDVLVVGHTDTMGSSESNFELAQRRASAVRAMLVAAGLDGRSVAIMSHGESQPLVQTPNGTYEPRNRRVDITVR